MRTRKASLSLRLAWILLISACFAVLAPLESAGMAVRMAFAGDVCSARVNRLDASASSSVDFSAGRQHHRKGSLPAGAHKHCPACFVHQDLAVAPPATLAVQAALTLQQRQRWQVHALPYQAVAWAHLPSRAPPTFLV